MRCSKCGKVISLDEERIAYSTEAYSLGGLIHCDSCLPSDAGAKARRLIPKLDLGFNWGAFFLTPIWLLFHGRAWLGAGLILLPVVASVGYVATRGQTNSMASAAIAALVSFVQFGAALRFGSIGNELAWEHKEYQSRRDLWEAQRPWAIAGIVLSLGFLIMRLLTL